MKAELGLSNFQWGLVGVAFQIAYAVFEPTTGHWGDRYGSRRVLIRIVLWWSAFTALTGCVWNVLRRAVARRRLQRLPAAAGDPLPVRGRRGGGAAERGAGHLQWFPPGRRGPPQALDQHLGPDRRRHGAGGGRLLHPVAVRRLALVVRDLRQPGRRLGVVLRPLVPRRPGHAPARQRRRAALHPRRPAAAPRRRSGTGPRGASPGGSSCANPNIWLLGVINACTSFFSYMLFLWFPTYLKEGRGLDEITSGRLGSLPYLFGATGVLLGGYLGDWLTARTGSRRLALGGMGTVGLLLAGTLVASSVHADSPLRGGAALLDRLLLLVHPAGRLVGGDGRRRRPAPGGAVRPVQHDRPGRRRHLAGLPRLVRRPHEGPGLRGPRPVGPGLLSLRRRADGRRPAVAVHQPPAPVVPAASG